MNILIFARENAKLSMNLTSEHIAQIKTISPASTITISDNPTEEELRGTEVLIPVLSLNKLPLSKMPTLKWIHVTSAGINKLPEEIELEKILITNSSGVHPLPISEQIFAYILMFARNMHLTYKAQITEKSWMKEKSKMSVFEIHGKTIGIIGMGRIGSEVAQVAKGFGMKVLGIVTDKNRTVENVDMLFEMNELDGVLSQSDIVVNCLPGTEATRGLYTLEKFKKMKSSALFINIGRGVSVVESDLVIALKENIIRGAGLDVFEKEPLSDESPLWNLENVIITPHSAGKTPYYMDRVIEIFCKNLKAFENNQEMPNKINPSKGY